MGTLGARDYEHMLDLAVDLLNNPRPELTWPLVAEELRIRLHGRISLLADLDWNAGTGHMVSGVPSWLDEAPMDSLITTHMRAHPLMRLYAAGSRRAVRTLDEVADRDWYRSPAYRAGRDTIGITRQLALPLRAPPGKIRSLIIGRADRDFTGREQDYAGRLQPLILALDAHITELERYLHSMSGSADLGDPGEFGLTQRELVVLALLTEGITAKAIAHRLSISPRTVTKHQENLYRKLGTKDRLSTVLTAQRYGLLQAATGALGRPPAPGGRGGRRWSEASDVAAGGPRG